VVLADDQGLVLGASSPHALRRRGLGVGLLYEPPNGDIPFLAESSIEDLTAATPKLLSSIAHASFEHRKIVASRTIRATEKKARRRADKIAGDAERAQEAPALRHTASLILSNLSSYREGSSSLLVTDWAKSPPGPTTIAIDRAVGPKKQAAALFHKARRLERGLGIARQRASETEGQLEQLRDLRERCARIEEASELDALIAGEASLCHLDRESEARPDQRKKKHAERRPYRRFMGFGDRPVLVGRGSADNDTLTLKHSRPSDLWRHARGYRGAHVVVPLGRGESCPPELLADAAMLAAHFSEAKGEDVVEVQYTPRRYVTKPKGAAPGLVTVRQEKTINVRVLPNRLAELLKSEQR